MIALSITVGTGPITAGGVVVIGKIGRRTSIAATGTRWLLSSHGRIIVTRCRRGRFQQDIVRRDGTLFRHGLGSTMLRPLLTGLGGCVTHDAKALVAAQPRILGKIKDATIGSAVRKVNVGVGRVATDDL